MARLLKWCSWWLVIVPIFASAETVVINANATGIFPGYSFPLDQFTDDLQLEMNDLYPVTITMTAEFDPDGPDYMESTYPPTLVARQLNMPATFTMLIAGRTFEFSGLTTVEASSSPGMFELEVQMQNMSFTFEFALALFDSSLGLSGHPLSPRSLSTLEGLSAGYQFASYPSNPDAPGSWRDSGAMSSATVNVLSAVPEPGQAGMLAAGMLLLMLAARRGRMSIVDRPQTPRCG